MYRDANAKTFAQENTNSDGHKFANSVVWAKMGIISVGSKKGGAMSTIYVEPAQKAGEVLYLVQSAIESEMTKLELGLERARKRLAPFEQKYGVSSEHFISAMAAEDLEGGDDEYVHWAGEYKLMQRLEEKLRQLREINYGDSGLPGSD
jgi:hypothetical protein